MNRIKLIDNKFGIKDPAFEVANELIDVSFKDDFGTKIRTFPFYNGRESSIGVSLEKDFYKNSYRQLNIIFGENRNSDNIFVDLYLKTTWNRPSFSDFQESDIWYKNRKYFESDGAKKAASFIKRVIKQYMKIKTLEEFNNFEENLYKIK